MEVKQTENVAREEGQMRTFTMLKITKQRMESHDGYGDYEDHCLKDGNTEDGSELEDVTNKFV